MARTRKTVIILISGKAGTGKTTVSDILTRKLSEIKGLEIMKYSFANPIKYMALAFFGWNKEKDEKGRKLLQQIGAVGREYDQDVWVKHLLNQLDKSKSVFPTNFVIIDDWRFPNELNFLNKNPLLDVVMVRVFGRGGLDGENAFDISENSLPEVEEEKLTAASYKEFESLLYYDHTIENSGDLELLEHKLDIILAEIQKQYIV